MFFFSYTEILSCESKGPVTFNNRKGCSVERTAAKKTNLSAWIPMANVASDTDALSWKHREMKKGTFEPERKAEKDKKERKMEG